MAVDVSIIFQDAVFSAPEGNLIAKPERILEEDGDRLSVLLWFYDAKGTPLEDNLTAILDGSRVDEPTYRARVQAAVQKWLQGIRDGEPVIDVAV